MRSRKNVNTLSAVFQLTSKRRLFWGGFSVVPCAFLLMMDTSPITTGASKLFARHETDSNSLRRHYTQTYPLQWRKRKFAKVPKIHLLVTEWRAVSWTNEGKTTLLARARWRLERKREWTTFSHQHCQKTSEGAKIQALTKENFSMPIWMITSGYDDSWDARCATVIKQCCSGVVFWFLRGLDGSGDVFGIFPI